MLIWDFTVYFIFIQKPCATAAAARKHKIKNKIVPIKLKLWLCIIFVQRFWRISVSHSVIQIPSPFSFLHVSTLALVLQFRQEYLDTLYRYAKFQYECGNYSGAAEYLYFFRVLVSPTSPVFTLELLLMSENNSMRHPPHLSFFVKSVCQSGLWKWDLTLWSTNCSNSSEGWSHRKEHLMWIAYVIASSIPCTSSVLAEDSHSNTWAGSYTGPSDQQQAA